MFGMHGAERKGRTRDGAVHLATGSKLLVTERFVGSSSEERAWTADLRPVTRLKPIRHKWNGLRETHDRGPIALPSPGTLCK